MEKKTITITVSVQITTDKSIEEVKKAVEKSIYRGLDTPPMMIAQPKDVKFNVITVE